MEAVPHQKPSDNGLDKNTSNFVDVMQSRELSSLNTPIDVGYYAALVSHLGNAAYKSGQRLTWDRDKLQFRSEEHTSELQSLMRISYAVFCLQKKRYPHKQNNTPQHS